MTNGEMIQKVFTCEVCEPIPEDDIIHVIFSDKSNSAIGFDLSWWNMEYKEPTTKNDLGVDCISREDALDCVNWGYSFSDIYKKINELPSVTPQEPQTFKWCDTCKEYDQEKHCCHRWSKVIRDTVEEMKQEPILDKLRAEIKALSPEPTAYDVVDGNPIKDAVWETIADVLKIVDKYKAESEAEE